MFLATLLQKDRLYISQLFVSRRPQFDWVMRLLDPVAVPLPLLYRIDSVDGGFGYERWRPQQMAMAI